ncbi:MAG TPA: peptide-methionine (S)-S-oxide reductase MsrA [Leptolyngbyaceae cyanobacterium]
MDKATFAAGCFWGVEDTFRQVKGVLSTSVGYTGGHWPNPCYLDVCARVTGHAEAVQIEYDPAQVSYEQLLEVFWNCHDPTQLNRQGPDRGEQYRSVIFFHTPDQERLAKVSQEKLQISSKYDQEIVTQIQPAGEFYLAEEYHQQYLEKKRRKLSNLEAFNGNSENKTL